MLCSTWNYCSMKRGFGKSAYVPIDNGFWENFACGIERVVPSGQDRFILPARVANHSARYRSSCPLAELAI